MPLSNTSLKIVKLAKLHPGLISKGSLKILQISEGIIRGKIIKGRSPVKLLLMQYLVR